MPRLGQKYAIDVEAIAKSREEYQSEVYKASGLPAAPAVMVGNGIAAQGPSISEEGLEAVIRRYLGLPPLKPEK
jgi:hypothetical protein